MQTPVHHFSPLNDIGDFVVPVLRDQAGSKSNYDKKSALIEKFRENHDESNSLSELDWNEVKELSFSRFASMKPDAGQASPILSKNQNSLLQQTQPAISRIQNIPSSLLHSKPHNKQTQRLHLRLSENNLTIEHPDPLDDASFSLSPGPKQGLSKVSGFDPIQPPSLDRDAPKPLLLITPNSKKRITSVGVSLTPAQFNLNDTNLHNDLEMLHNYEMGPLIGNGAFASVYRARNKLTGEVVAIKQIRLEQGQDVSAAMGEIDLLKILKHPNIVKYHGFAKDSTTFNLVLEFCEGGSLRQLYKRKGKGFSEAKVKYYVKGILHGLAYLHSQGVVHRDVKASNVLLTSSNDVKLADFGVAARENSQHHTVVGTPNWMAPETILGGDGLCTSSDIWSLGATIIELLTTNPPYHDLNPMAALHAIGTDEYPPLPKGISQALRDFLLECFQKQPNLRISAKLLLNHQWLLQDNNASTEKKLSLNNLKHQESKVPYLINLSSFDNKHGNAKQSVNQVAIIEAQAGDVKIKPQIHRTNLSKNDLLSKFQESENVDDILLNDLEMNTKVVKDFAVANFGDESKDKDPFLDIDVHDFDSNELEIQVKMEYLVTKLGRKLERIGGGGEQDSGPSKAPFKYTSRSALRSTSASTLASTAAALVKITGRMLHLIKKYPFLHDAFVRDHGVLNLLELLQLTQELSDQQQLWYHALSILNFIFESNIGQLENFCFLGGIPAVSHFRSSNFDVRVRLQVARFINCLIDSKQALSMFVSCGGLRLVSKFVEEDYDNIPLFQLTAVDSIYAVLMTDVSRSKSDLCRILSKHDVLFWFLVLLNRLTQKENRKEQISESSNNARTIQKIIDVVRCFSQSEVKVRTHIASADMFKLVIRIYQNISFQQQLALLKFLKSMSCIPEILEELYKADILEFLAGLLEQYGTLRPKYKDVMNLIAPVLYGCLYLNNDRMSEFLDMGTLPYLKSLAQMNLPFRQFILPIMCELVHCDSSVRANMKRHDILGLYHNLILDPYWQSNALESILHWSKVNPHYVRINGTTSVNCLTAGFIIPKVASVEAVLDVYLQLLSSNTNLVRSMLLPTVLKNILQKLELYVQSPVVQLLLLKILKCIVSFNSRDLKNRYNDFSILYVTIKEAMDNLALRRSSILIDEVAKEICFLVSTQSD